MFAFFLKVLSQQKSPYSLVTIAVAVAASAGAVLPLQLTSLANCITFLPKRSDEGHVCGTEQNPIHACHVYCIFYRQFRT